VVAHLRDGGSGTLLAKDCQMQQALPMSTLVAARQALAEQQVRALREWLGEDHELLTTPTGVSAQAAPDAAPCRPMAKPPIGDEVSA
jgi:hypothetical protein